MRTAILFAFLFTAPLAEAADPATTAAPAAAPSETTAATQATWAAAPAGTVKSMPRQVVRRGTARRAALVEDIRVLGDVKLLRAEEGQARLRIDGEERTLRPGMLLKTDTVRSITADRMVLLRPDGVDGRKGEALIIVDFLGGGRSRVRSYATRNWTAQPPVPAE